MLSYTRGRVIEIVERLDDITKVKVELEDRISNSINYNKLTGPIEEGDLVIINTTAVELGLGTGGVDFIINNLAIEEKDFQEEGHIMKLRYTPFQIKCMAAEAQESHYHDIFLDFDSLDGHICIVGSLHSMLAPIVTSLKYINPDLNINYIMTDGGCLPIAFSNTVKDLKKDGLINKTITIGHAFGGDLECINIYNGLIASKEILKSDITIVTMGPGIVGSGTPYGFSGMEQGQIVDAVTSLGGKPILVPRIGFTDLRERHRGISHHTRTVLEKGLHTRASMVISNLEDDHRRLVEEQLVDLRLEDKVDIIYEDGSLILDALDKFNYNTKTMGRGIQEEKDYFFTLGAIANYSNKVFLKGEA